MVRTWSISLGGKILGPQAVHVGAGALLPRLAVQQSQRAADHVAGLLILAAVRLDDAEVFFGRTESDTHKWTVQQLFRQPTGTLAAS
jgi:hypothetical protein